MMPNGEVIEREEFTEGGILLGAGEIENKDSQWFRKEIRKAYSGRARSPGPILAAG